MERDLLMKIGREVTLILGDDRLHSRMIDIKEDYIYLDLPVHMDTRKTFFLQKGHSLIVQFVGKDKVFYQFKTKIVECQLEDLPKLIIRKPKKIERIQRRKFVRIQTALDIAVHSVNKTFHPFTTVSYDISGGGLSIIVPANTQLLKNDLVKIFIVLPMGKQTNHYISTKAKVLRLQKNKDRITLASLQFKNIYDVDQQKIVQFCLAKQREMRRKELE